VAKDKMDFMDHNVRGVMSQHDPRAVRCFFCGGPNEKYPPAEGGGYGNSAYPYPGRCCNRCYPLHVPQAREKLATAVRERIRPADTTVH